MSQSQEIQELKKSIDAVKKNTVKELAVITQDLIDLTHEGKIESFFIITETIRKIGVDPYNQIRIRVAKSENKTNKDERNSFALGSIEDDKDLFINSKISETELGKKLSSINNSLGLINLVCKDVIPSHKNTKNKNSDNDNIMFVFSLQRLNLKGNWTESIAKDWPMIPSYLDDLVDLNGTEKIPSSNKKRKP